MDEMITIIETACLKFRDSGLTSCTAEARNIIEALEENDYVIHKIEPQIDSKEESIRKATEMLQENNYEVNKIEPKPAITLDESIIKALERAYEMSIDIIRKKIRKREILEARQVGMFFNVIAKGKTQLSYSKIGELFVDPDSSDKPFDHATVYHAYNTIINLLPQASMLDMRLKVEKISKETGIKYQHLL
jgi:chromosomal replication initiation ATPase DnaA